jgi:hypothetical protein
VFLVGFPRSGTTLIEEVLATHPDVVTVSEQEYLIDGFRELMGDANALDRLSAITAPEAERFRKSYWDKLRAGGVDPAGRLVLDKQPLNTIKLPLITKLFPDAKILFAVRDPRDVVWSCFRQRFQMNSDMYEFVTLDGTVRFYDAVMALAVLYKKKLPLDIHFAYYERLVEDFELQTRAICRFAGIEWHEGLRDFAARAPSRTITTPSAAQIARGLYTSGIGQWRPYAEFLAPALEQLRFWVDGFDYHAG